MQLPRSYIDATKAFAAFYATTAVLFGLNLVWMGVTDPLFIGYVSVMWPILAEVPLGTSFREAFAITIGFTVGGIYAHSLRRRQAVNPGGEN